MIALSAVLGWHLLAAASSSQTPTTNFFFSQPLTLSDAVNLALKRNPDILRAQKDLEAAQGIVIQTRAIVVPKLSLNGRYSAVDSGDVDKLRLPGTNAINSLFANTGGFSIGTDQSWTSQLRLVQSLYEGGRITSSLRTGRLTREQSLLNYQTTVANTVLAVQVGFYDVLLDVQQITVQEASVELLEQELADTKRRYDAGTVPRFNVLRAEVELANARPRLIRARNSLRIAKNNLSNLLGLNVPKETFEDIPLNLAGKLEAEPYGLDLPKAIALALENRSELGALRKAQALRKEDVIGARGGYKPSLEAYAGYDVHSSIFGLALTDEVHGWITGVQLNWDIFDGWRSRGKVMEATALYEKAGVDVEDAGRRIELEVRTAWSNFKEADEVLKSQEKVVEEAEEALRLARARSEAGSGTQLDVLGAQTSLTEARTTQVQALHDYAVARARLERAVGGSAKAKG